MENRDFSRLDDHKSALQEFSVERFKEIPRYETVEESGPPHKKKFEVEAILKGRVYGRGCGQSKKEAQQAAAKCAYAKLMDEQLKQEAQ